MKSIPKPAIRGQAFKTDSLKFKRPRISEMINGMPGNSSPESAEFVEEGGGFSAVDEGLSKSFQEYNRISDYNERRHTVKIERESAIMELRKKLKSEIKEGDPEKRALLDTWKDHFESGVELPFIPRYATKLSNPNSFQELDYYDLPDPFSPSDQEESGSDQD